MIDFETSVKALTSEEAHLTECRQASHLNVANGKWTFPPCSGHKCGHWLELSTYARKAAMYFPPRYVEGQSGADFTAGQNTAIDDWLAKARAIEAEGFEATLTNDLAEIEAQARRVKRGRNLTYTKLLAKSQRPGRCGLIAEHDITVETSCG